jgi:hypothetical protein
MNESKAIFLAGAVVLLASMHIPNSAHELAQLLQVAAGLLPLSFRLS